MKGATLGESVEEDIPRIKEALQIYANAEDLNNILDAISTQINVTFNQMIITLKEQMLGYSISVNSQSVDSARENLSTALAAAGILSTDADESTVPIITWYKNWLK
jgi:phosphoribosylaminoimidazole (AIR) synthetase